MKTYRPVIRRLHKALQNPNIEEEMDLEDELLNEFHKKDELLAAALQREEEEKRRAEEEKRRAEEALQQAEEARTAKHDMIRRLHAMGMSLTQIASVAGMEEADVEALLNEAKD